MRKAFDRSGKSNRGIDQAFKKKIKETKEIKILWNLVKSISIFHHLVILFIFTLVMDGTMLKGSEEE